MSRIDFHGYKDCIALENESTRVVLGHHCGGHVLEYTWQGENTLYHDPKTEGWMYDPEQPIVQPTGGRFDVGPPRIPKHLTLWVGPWEAEETGPRTARLTSAPDEAIGIQLTREFALDEKTSHLVCTQTMRNVSDQETAWCHWARTLALGGGICLVPLTPNGRFPKGYVMSCPPGMLSTRPEDPMVRVRNDIVEIIGKPENSKLMMDSHAGWICYLMPNDALFVKRFPTYPDRPYAELTACTVAIYYADMFCELEPIGPLERIAPGESASFTQDWWLIGYEFPKPGSDFDLDQVVQVVEQEAR